MRPPGMPNPFSQPPLSLITRCMAVHRELGASGDDELTVQSFAQRIGWTEADVVNVAEWCRDLELIDTDAGMGDQIATIEGHY